MAAGQLTLPELIRGGFLEQYASKFRYCRDVLRSRQSCRDYAERKLMRDFPRANPLSFRIAIDRAEAAQSRATDLRLIDRDTPITGFGAGDVTETLRKRFGPGALKYRYVGVLTYSYLSVDRDTHFRSWPLAIDSDEPISLAEIERQAAEMFASVPRVLLGGTPPIAENASYEVERTQVDTAFRTRTYG